MSNIRVLIVDDHGIVRAGIKSLLETQPDIEVVAEASEGREALEKVRQLRPDVVLMDIAMPGMNGLEATREIKREMPESSVLALTMQDNEEYFFPMLSAGASGYVLKEASSEELLTAVRAVYEGGAFLSPAVARAVLEDYLQGVATGSEKDSYSFLSDREKEVLKLAAEGKTNREMAEALFLSTKTIEKHRATMMHKLGLANRSELVRYAIKKGLIDLDE
jgi:two-component system response regulator NreC